MSDIVVAARSRTETGKNSNRRLRASGWIPGVLYGPGQDAVPVAVAPKDITAILRSGAGENTLFNLEVEGTAHKVILKEYQVDPIHSALLHADFCEVALDRPIKVTVHVELTGTPVGVKQGGLLDFITRELDVECLPGDLPEKIVADVSDLDVGMHLRVSQLEAPKGVQILTAPGVVVAHVVVKRADVSAAGEEAPADEAATPAEEAAADPKADKKADKKAAEKK